MSSKTARSAAALPWMSPKIAAFMGTYLLRTAVSGTGHPLSPRGLPVLPSRALFPRRGGGPCRDLPSFTPELPCDILYSRKNRSRSEGVTGRRRKARRGAGAAHHGIGRLRRLVEVRQRRRARGQEVLLDEHQVLLLFVQ